MNNSGKPPLPAYARATCIHLSLPMKTRLEPLEAARHLEIASSTSRKPQRERESHHHVNYRFLGVIVSVIVIVIVIVEVNCTGHKIEETMRCEEA